MFKIKLVKDKSKLCVGIEVLKHPAGTLFMCIRGNFESSLYVGEIVIRTNERENPLRTLVPSKRDITCKRGDSWGKTFLNCDFAILPDKTEKDYI